MIGWARPLLDRHLKVEIIRSYVSQVSKIGTTLELLFIRVISESKMIISSCFSVRMKRRNVDISEGSVMVRRNKSKYAVAVATSSKEFCEKITVLALTPLAVRHRIDKLPYILYK